MAPSNSDSPATSEDRVFRAIENYCKAGGLYNSTIDGETSSRSDDVDLEALDMQDIPIIDEGEKPRGATSADIVALSTNNAQLNDLRQRVIPTLLRMQESIIRDLEKRKRMSGGLKWRLRALEARLKEKDTLIRELSDNVKELSDGKDLVVMQMRKEVVQLQQELRNRRSPQRVSRFSDESPNGQFYWLQQLTVIRGQRSTRVTFDYASTIYGSEFAMHDIVLLV